MDSDSGRQNMRKTQELDCQVFPQARHGHDAQAACLTEPFKSARPACVWAQLRLDPARPGESCSRGTARADDGGSQAFWQEEKTAALHSFATRLPEFSHGVRTIRELPVTRM